MNYHKYIEHEVLFYVGKISNTRAPGGHDKIVLTTGYEKRSPVFAKRRDINRSVAEVLKHKGAKWIVKQQRMGYNREDEIVRKYHGEKAFPEEKRRPL